MNKNEVTQFQYRPLGIADVLRSYDLAVPIYQRSYSWESSARRGQGRPSDVRIERLQVVEFWDDLIQSFISETPYFLGTVVLTAGDGTSDGRHLIIDGQQRLATASMLLAAIRDCFEEKGEIQSANSTQQDFLGHYDKKSKSDVPKLRLNTEDNDYYESRVVLRQNSTPVGYSQSLIATAYEALSQRVREFTSQADADWYNRLTDLETWLRSSAQVVVIVVSTEADAFLIFETLNDRGADLTVADLLKNFLFSQAGEERLNEVQRLWHQMLSNLGVGPVGNQVFTSFARHFLSSKTGLVRERDLFRTIKSRISSPKDVVGFAKELERSAKTYYAILNSDSDYWSQFGADAVGAAEVIAELQIERYRPLILAAVDELPQKEVGRFLVALVSWSVRMLAAGSLGGGFAEAAFCDVAVEVRNGIRKTAAEILAYPRLDDLVPKDEEFESVFFEWRVIPRIGRYALRALELARRGNDEPELVVNQDVEAVNLEHVLPKNAKGPDWSSISAEDRKRLVDRLGNMVLMQKGKNTRIGSKSWKVKQPVLAKSELILTSEAAKANDWDKDTITRRQLELAKLAVKCWPRTTL